MFVGHDEITRCKNTSGVPVPAGTLPREFSSTPSSSLYFESCFCNVVIASSRITALQKLVYVVRRMEYWTLCVQRFYRPLSASGSRRRWRSSTTRASCAPSRTTASSCASRRTTTTRSCIRCVMVWCVCVCGVCDDKRVIMVWRHSLAWHLLTHSLTCSVISKRSTVWF